MCVCESVWCRTTESQSNKGESLNACAAHSKNQLTSELDQNNNRLAPSMCDLLREQKERKKNNTPTPQQRSCQNLVVCFCPGTTPIVPWSCAESESPVHHLPAVLKKTPSDVNNSQQIYSHSEVTSILPACKLNQMWTNKLPWVHFEDKDGWKMEVEEMVPSDVSHTANLIFNHCVINRSHWGLLKVEILSFSRSNMFIKNSCYGIFTRWMLEIDAKFLAKTDSLYVCSFLTQQ